MGDALLRVQTKYPSAQALLLVVGPSLQRGSLRVPLHVAFEQPFELSLVSLDGEEAVCGTAEVVEHAGDATWVRFLSASADSASEPARCVLVDTEVMSPASLASKADAFDVITAVSDEPARVASLPLPPPPDPLFDVTDASKVEPLPQPPPDAASTIAEAAARACLGSDATSETTVDKSSEKLSTDFVDFASDPTSVESRRDVDAAALAALEGRFDAITDATPPVPEDDLRVPHTGESKPLVDARDTELRMPALEAAAPEPVPTNRATEESKPIVVDEPANIHDSTPPDDQRPTIEAAPLVATLAHMTAGNDAVAAQRGIRAITNPYAKTGVATSSSTKRIVIAAASVAAVSLLIAAGSLMWAQDAVARAEQPKPAPVAAAVEPAPVVEQPPVVEQAPVVEQQPVVEQPPQQAPAQPTTCTLDVFSTVADASVYIDGAANGSTPATATVECGKPVSVEIRHARYETFKKTVTPTGREELRATLEREKTALTVWSEPQGAMVSYNGKRIGKTPLTVKIPRYEQGQIDFAMPGMQPDWRRIVPKTAEKTVTIALKKK